MMLQKLGLSNYYAVPDLSQDTLKTLQDFCTRLEQILSAIDTDMTLFYRTLATWKNHQDPTVLTEIKDHFLVCFYDPSQADENYLTQLSNWLQEYQAHLLQQSISDEIRKGNMDKVNPCYILRNFQVQEAIELAENGDYSRVFTLCELLKTPYEQQEKYKKFEVKRPSWAMNKFGCSALSCSS